VPFFQEPDEILREDLLQLEYGNKIAILGGDYLLANACTGLADLRNTYIVEMISIAIAEFTQVVAKILLYHYRLFQSGQDFRPADIFASVQKYFYTWNTFTKTIDFFNFPSFKLC